MCRHVTKGFTKLIWGIIDELHRDPNENPISLFIRRGHDLLLSFKTIVCYAEFFLFTYFCPLVFNGMVKGKVMFNLWSDSLGDLPLKFCIFLLAYWQQRKLDLTHRNSVLSNYVKLNLKSHDRVT